MPAKLSAKERLKLIEKVIVDGEPVVKVCQEAGISRVLFYRWLKRYKEKGTFGPQGQTHEASLKTSPELSPQKRLEMVERVVKFGQPVSEVCRQFNLSRPTFYKWLKRYQSITEVDKDVVLEAKKPEVKHYYRQTPEKYEEAVLSVVGQYPQFGVERIVKVLPEIGGKPILGYHGVQNVLRRHNLSTYEQRFVFAQAQVTPATRFITRLVAIGTRFVSLPAEARVRLVRFGAATLITSFITVVVLGSIGYFVTITTQAPVASRTGFVFATIALLVGSLFFAYSMKYYLTLALVLSFSRQPNEEGVGIGLKGEFRGNGNGNGKGNQGFLSRIFGLTSGGNGNGKETLKAPGLTPSLDHINITRYPFISIHLPFYNEKNVANRIISACTSFDYPSTRDARSGQVVPNYEVIICDDSTDETMGIVNEWSKHPKVKILHRPTREGFKGGALSYAIQKMNPKTEFVLVFDADFVPYPDTLTAFLKYFKASGGWDEGRSYQGEKILTMPYDTFSKVEIPSSQEQQLSHQEQELLNKSNIACVAGYQWHVLNKSENWITRGVRTEYAGSYVIERPGQEILGALKIIHGSVYCIRADVLKHFGWGTSITEDFELTLRIYEKGFKVAYTPYIQAPSECVSTIKRLIRQRMRWSEGHSFNVKKMFGKLISNPNLTLMEKLEFLYITPYYLQAFFFLLGTLSWLISETVFKARLPFWTSLWGWSLVLTNMLALPLLNAVGMFLEEAEEKDYLGILSFVALSYLLVPFQAYAAVKGFLEPKEGTWFRTPKTGRITDIFTRGQFYRFLVGILPGRKQARAEVMASLNPFKQTSPSAYLALATANNTFNNFKIRPRKMRLLGRIFMVILLIISLSLFSLTKGIPEVLATNPSTTQYLSNNGSSVLTGPTSAWQLLDSVDSPQGSTSITVDRNEAVDVQLQIEPGQTNTAPGTKCSSTPNGRGWILDTAFQPGGSIASGTWSFFIYESDAGVNRDGHIDVCVYRTTISGGNIGTANLLFQSEGDSAWSTIDTMNGGVSSISQTTSTESSFNIGAGEYLYIEYWYHNVTKVNEVNVTMNFYTGESGATDPYVQMPTITIPENILFLTAATPLVLGIILWMRKRKELLIRI